ncbi:MAG: hypothetical protein K8R53_01280, partial [Bacteroidales bacterium]|nr:hypothetical protein [Bacteroidales bacterium]
MHSRKKKILIFGAGKIGRSFIGQLFGCDGYEVVFIDISKLIINALNLHRKYPVIIKDVKGETIWVKNVRGVLTTDTEKIVTEISDTDLIAVCVGQMSLLKIAPSIAKGIFHKHIHFPKKRTDIILAENLRNAGTFFSNELKNLLPEDFPLHEKVGMVETSIGKMVPIMPVETSEKDPLLVYAEAYNTLILDRHGFLNHVPEVAGLAPKENMKAWVDRKLFIHNLGHATAAYFGNFLHPDKIYVYEVLKDIRVEKETREVMSEAGNVLRAVHPGEFTRDQIQDHINNLVGRFKNEALGDTIFRVGCDLNRKLGYSDRLVAPMVEAYKRKLPYEQILKAYVCAFSFSAKDENNIFFPGDEQIIDLYKNRGIE